MTAIDELPVTRPAHLRPADRSRRGWLARRLAGLGAAALGLISFIVVAAAQHTMLALPDWRLSVPGLVAAAVAAAISLARREHAAALWLAGLGLAAAAVVLGWFFLFAIVIAAAAVLILILHAVM